MLDKLKHIWMLYRKPILLNVVTVIIYILLDGPTTDGSRTPMPPHERLGKNPVYGSRCQWICQLAVDNADCPVRVLQGQELVNASLDCPLPVKPFKAA